MAKVPADCVWGQDNVTVSALDNGFTFYAGYHNGPFANMTALRARFGSKYLMSVATRFAGSAGATSVDVEPGTLATDQATSFRLCLAWIRQGGHPSKPVVYVMASWAQALVNFLAANGVARGSYYLWTAHYSGQHLCGPGGCGFLSGTIADLTQYASGRNDFNVSRGYVVGGGGKPVPGPAGAKLGDSGPQVVTIQKQLNTWAKYCGFPALLTDGDFGGKTYNAVRLFQEKRGQGLTVDGVVGPDTEKYLQNPPGAIKKIVTVVKPKPSKPVVPSGIPALLLGDNGKPVAAMQYYLRNSGLVGVRGIDADGDFGQKTLTSLKNFQRLKGLTQDGVYGPATAKALSKVALG